MKQPAKMTRYLEQAHAALQEHRQTKRLEQIENERCIDTIALSNLLNALIHRDRELPTTRKNRVQP